MVVTGARFTCSEPDSNYCKVVDLAYGKLQQTGQPGPRVVTVHRSTNYLPDSNYQKAVDHVPW
jgi:hypothetical protein